MQVLVESVFFSPDPRDIIVGYKFMETFPYHVFLSAYWDMIGHVIVPLSWVLSIKVYLPADYSDLAPHGSFGDQLNS